ncbi:GspH/FimT family pseudopilin [Ectopseudomonas khazarica]|uniref:GspH/FimT family pseudopilin n=1 Tax=Ectopseudomonas khazarica TaxID=2502979 RepID=UPI0040338C04
MSITLRPRPADTCNPGGRRHAGFTLIELMIIVSMISIFALIAVPNFTQLVANNRTQSQNNELLSLLQFARSTAVEQRRQIKVCQDQDVWSVKADCEESTEALRSMTLSGGASVSASSSELTFHYNGTGQSASLLTCHDGDFANGYTIDVQASGRARSWARGKNGPSSDDNMTTCTVQSGGDDDGED